MKINEIQICVIGQGYVGLPLSIEFGKYFNTIGFDINSKRIEELKAFSNKTKESTKEQIKSSKNLSFTCN